VAPPEDSILQCGPSRRIKSYDVAPSAGSNPTVWPLPQDRILWCGPSRRIDSLGTRKGQGHGQGQGQGSDFPLWPLPGDWTFRCGPSRGIGLSDVAPPRGLDFLMWPLPGDRTFRCGPSLRIESYGVALPTGSLPHRGIVRIFFESMLLPSKGQSTKNVCMVEQYYPRPIIFML
jgi:hypothetical protein